jgi:hypothetical protein
VEHLHALHWLGLLDMHATNSFMVHEAEEYVAVVRFAEDLADDANDLLSAGMPFASTFFDNVADFTCTWDKLHFLNTMARVSERGRIGEHLALKAVEARCSYDSRIGVREAQLFAADPRWSYDRKAQLLLLGGFPSLATAVLLYSGICAAAPGAGDRRVDAWLAIRRCYHVGFGSLEAEEGLHATLSHLVGMQAMLNSPLWSPAPPDAQYIEQPDTSLDQGTLRQVFALNGCTHGHRPDFTPTYSITSTVFLDEHPGLQPIEGRGVSVQGFKVQATPFKLSVSATSAGPLEHPVAASVMVQFLTQPGGSLLPVAMPRLAFVRPLSLHEPHAVPFGAAPVLDAMCLTYVFEDASATPHISQEDGSYLTSWP